MADENAAGAKTGPDGTAAENAGYATKADLDALTATLAGIATTLKSLPNTVNAAAKSQLDRQLKALGLTPEALAKLNAPPKAEDDPEEAAAAEAERAAQAEAKRAAKAAKESAAAGGQPQAVDIEGLLKKHTADMEAQFEKRFKAQEAAQAKALADERAKREAAERSQIEFRGLTAAKSELAKHVLPEVLDLAFDALKARSHLHVAEDGNPYYRATPTDEDGQVPFAEGITQWLDQPACKVFRPAPTVGAPKNGKTPQAAPGRKPVAPPLASNGTAPAPASPEAIESAVQARHGTSLSSMLLNPGTVLNTPAE
jgi:hypothetical protein